MLFRRLFLCALVSGLCVGLLHSAVQRWQVIPIIKAAEVFESSLTVAASTAGHHHQAAAGAHHHEVNAWEPANQLERTFWTVIANGLTGIAFALMLLPAMAFWDRFRGGNDPGWRSGLLWGVAGWLCFFVWPAIGLQPELPGEQAAALGVRQSWWLLAVIGGTSGFGLLCLVRSHWRWLGVALLALPFALGAPTIDAPFAPFNSEVATQMAGLKSQFLFATALASVVQWVTLGALCGWLSARWLRPLIASDTSLPNASQVTS